MMKKYIYFISFSCQDEKSNDRGFGCVEVTMNRPVVSLNELAEIVPRIQNEHNLIKITPLYYALLRTEEKD